MKTIIYAVHEQVARGKVICVDGTTLIPAYMIFHSQMEATVLAVATGSNLVHIRDLYPAAEEKH